MGEIDRIGIGTDLHRLGAGRRLVLGGVEIDFDKGCIGHSDGDVVLHAVTDAVLGAAGLADIGELFPDTDAKFTDADSGLLLAEAVRLVREAGWAIVNVDVVVHAERPKLSEYKAAMRKRMAGVLGIDSGSVNVKAKTGEGVGPVGEGEAISCVAVAGVQKVKFSDCAKNAMDIAEEEARALDHEYVGTEHILLGLIREGTGHGAKVLKSLGIRMEDAREAVSKLVKRGLGDMNPDRPLSKTPRSKRILNFAFEEHRVSGNQSIGTEHLLLALLREKDGLGCQVLAGLGCNEKKVREELLKVLS